MVYNYICSKIGRKAKQTGRKDSQKRRYKSQLLNKDGMKDAQSYCPWSLHTYTHDVIAYAYSESKHRETLDKHFVH